MEDVLVLPTSAVQSDASASLKTLPVELLNLIWFQRKSPCFRPPPVLPHSSPDQASGYDIVDDYHSYVLESQDICNLRLSCRIIYEKTQEAFRKVCFTEVKYAITPWSLRDLLALSEHKILRKYVQKISFGTERLNQELEGSLMTRLPLGEYRKWHSNYEATYTKMCVEQYQMTLCDCDVSMIVKAVSNLPNLRVVSVGTETDDRYLGHHGLCPSRGNQQLLKSLGGNRLDKLYASERLFTLNVAEKGHNYRTVLNALSHIRDHDISLDLYLRLPVRGSYGSDPFNIIEVSFWESSCDLVQTLTLARPANWRSSSRTPLLSPKASFIYRMLNEAKNLRSLRMIDLQCYGLRIEHEAVNDAKWRNLTSLTICQSTLEAELLMNLLSRHTLTLERIFLEKVLLTGSGQGENWLLVLRMLQKIGAQLKTIELGSLSEDCRWFNSPPFLSHLYQLQGCGGSVHHLLAQGEELYTVLENVINRLGRTHEAGACCGLLLVGLKD